MLKRMGIVAGIHFLALALLLLPSQFKGPEAFQISSISFKVVDIAAVSIILIGSVLLYYWILTSNRRPDNQTNE